jgi:uncharacterized membrane protein (Fun14 family)
VNKILLGLLLGALLGLFDGWTARFYDTVRPDEYTMIMGGSTFKGVVTGLAAGFAARKWNSIKAGLSAGLIVGLLFSAIIGYNEGETRRLLADRVARHRARHRGRDRRPAIRQERGAGVTGYFASTAASAWYSRRSL